jgi:hypothetical protein
MSLMGWNAFRAAHHRPFLVQLQLVAKAPQARFNSLQRFFKSMNLTGNFALSRGSKSVRVAFELEADAIRVVQTLGARDAGRGDEWAGQWRAFLEGEVAAKIPTLVSPSSRSPGPQMRPKRRLRP